MTRARVSMMLFAAALAVPLIALAAGDDRSASEAGIAALDGDPHTKELCADPIVHARLALERGHRMRIAGDTRHALLAEGLALEWVHVGQELARADAMETRAAAARVITNDAGAHVERERATLEQQLAENGRLQAELARAEDGGAPKADPKNVTVARDGGAR